ncbi:aspartyl/asparaginyl beta-hydroxylase [Capsulimonas corticalis]|uniref:Aspartyl/asparaginyl beta-hydroxylase n=1 Tax=Capsulimonas corticalis TaxID=2219043 RepID=A0A402D056_9BACT|nr:aspartyl/asparaginyl beta-hydroxylase domain-containing protein [Capsulimonas corticalis]BDI33721.1 aspartyl/asparaginyl beta-hydroxylase [Capsulimonas corticalis]
MKKFIEFAIKAGKILAKIAAVYAAVGAYDVLRNKPADKAVAKRYFTGNGILTWVLSPLNTLLDVLSLPYVNKGIWKLEDFPKEYQEEITRVLEASVRENLVAKLEETAKEHKRTMVFFKWYGENVENTIEIPDFHADYKYIQTIGVSVFNKKQSTSKHFGPFRATLRILYNINQMEDDSAYITVGNVNNYWRTDKLFIFDDTLMHQSFNETEQPRYNMFIDILRPSLVPSFFRKVVSTARFFLRSVNFLFYKNWDVVKG